MGAAVFSMPYHTKQPGAEGEVVGALVSLGLVKCLYCHRFLFDFFFTCGSMCDTQFWFSVNSSDRASLLK